MGALLEKIAAFESRFNEKFGWFFTNGYKSKLRRRNQDLS
jgi:hypothetical protein